MRICAEGFPRRTRRTACRTSSSAEEVTVQVIQNDQVGFRGSPATASRLGSQGAAESRSVRLRRPAPEVLYVELPHAAPSVPLRCNSDFRSSTNSARFSPVSSPTSLSSSMTRRAGARPRQ